MKYEYDNRPHGSDFGNPTLGKCNTIDYVEIAIRGSRAERREALRSIRRSAPKHFDIAPRLVAIERARRSFPKNKTPYG